MKVKVKQWKHHKRAVCFYSQHYNGSLCCSTSPLRVFSLAVMWSFVTSLFRSSSPPPRPRRSPSPPPRPRPPPSPLLRTPWRETTWGDNSDALQYLKEFQLQNEEATHIRVLLYGPVGVGKSSFINSVNNVLQGRMTNEALASATTADQSFTRIYRTYKIKKDRGDFYPFVFNDIMGLEDGEGRGVRAEDIILALNGHVKDNYKFNPASSLSDGDPGYNSSPSISDRVHVLVCIYSADAPQMKSSVLQKMREIREAASELGIPQLAILSHIDAACGETEQNLRNVYKSKHLKKKMGDFSSSLGIPMNCILPVKNYSDEIQLKPDVNTLILNAMRLMIDFGDDYAEKLRPL